MRVDVRGGMGEQIKKRYSPTGILMPCVRYSAAARYLYVPARSCP
jgi:hypothetical protein